MKYSYNVILEIQPIRFYDNLFSILLILILGQQASRQLYLMKVLDKKKLTKTRFKFSNGHHIEILLIFFMTIKRIVKPISHVKLD